MAMACFGSFLGKPINLVKKNYAIVISYCPLVHLEVAVNSNCWRPKLIGLIIFLMSIPLFIFGNHSWTAMLHWMLQVIRQNTKNGQNNITLFDLIVALLHKVLMYDLLWESSRSPLGIPVQWKEKFFSYTIAQ